MFPFHRTRISTLSITCIHIIKYVHSFYYTHISVCHFVGVFIYAGAINRPLQLRTVCDNAADGLLIMLRSPTKLVANIPPGVGGRFIAPVSLHYQKRVFTSSITCIHIIKYVHSFYYTHISVCHFVGVYVYAGAINRSPTAANGLPKCANGLPIIQYLCVIMRCLWDIKIGEAQNTFVFLHFSTTHFIRRYLGNCATIWRVACPKKVRCLC